MWLKWFCFTLCLIEAFGSDSEMFRVKRGAAVYATYQTSGAGQGSNIYNLNSNNPEGFIKYLGGGSSGSGTGAFDTGYLNTFNQHSQGSGTSYSSLPTTTARSGGGSSGWTPSNSNGNGNGGSGSHSLDANVLLQAAQGSFGAQTELFNALSSGSRPSSYKGGSTSY